MGVIRKEGVVTCGQRLVETRGSGCAEVGCRCAFLVFERRRSAIHAQCRASAAEHGARVLAKVIACDSASFVSSTIVAPT